MRVSGTNAPQLGSSHSSVQLMFHTPEQSPRVRLLEELAVDQGAGSSCRDIMKPRKTPRLDLDVADGESQRRGSSPTSCTEFLFSQVPSIHEPARHSSQLSSTVETHRAAQTLELSFDLAFDHDASFTPELKKVENSTCSPKPDNKVRRRESFPSPITSDPIRIPWG